MENLSVYSKRNNRILLITPIFPPIIGGPATYTWELAHRLRDYDLRIVAFGDAGKKIKGIPVHLIPVQRGLRQFPVIGSLIRQFDLARCLWKYGSETKLWYIQGPLVVGFMASLVGKLLRKDMVMKFVGDIAWETASRKGQTTQNLDEFLADGHGGVLRRLQRCAFRRMRAIIVPSEYLRNVLVSYYGIDRQKIHVIYNAVEVPETKKRVRDKVLVTVGRLVPHKNIAGIIEAMSMLKGYELRVIGEGPEGTALRDLVYELHANVKFLGSLPRQETLQEIANASALIPNSNYEGLPHTIVEAMYLRTPVVATNILGTSEVATPLTADLAEANNPEDLAETIKNITYKTEEAYRWVLTRFNWDQNIEHLTKVLMPSNNTI